MHHAEVKPRASHSAPRVVQHSSHSDHHRVEHHYSQATHREHHPVEWYRSNGWHHDNDYWRSHHQHRFCDDSGGEIYESSVEPYYAYDSTPYVERRVYVEPAPRYESTGVDYETRVAIQEELYRAGYYDGDIDGVIGPGTRRAIAEFQRDNSLSPTGLINSALLEALDL